MHTQAGAPLGRRRFLALSAGGAAALSGCALKVSNGVSRGGSGETVTAMVNLDDISPELVQQAQQELGIKVNVLAYDITRLIAMLTSGNPPDLVRGIGALDTPYYVARGVAENLDPYFARSTVLKVADLDPANDVWRFDGTIQGQGPRYGMAKDFSQDAMFWYNTELFDQAGVEYPDDTEPITYEEWLEKAERLVRRKNGQTTVYGGSYNGLGLGILFTNLTAAAGGKLFSDDFSRVDFTAPEARTALAWYVDYAKAKVGPSLIQPNPDTWDGPTYVANRMAMSGNGYWLGGMINAEAKIAEVSRLAPAPVFEGGPRLSSCQGGTGMWMPAKARNKDAAWRFFEWFFGEAPAKARAEGGWGIPSLKSLRPLMPAKEDYQQRVLKVQEDELEHFSVTPFTPYATYNAIDALINQIIPAAMNGQMSVDTLAGRLDSALNEQLKRGKEQVG
ncbi:extracellular solute-binding protein [Streptomyces sp. NBC_00287]|uniref:extracellular solute-binding protein n=1 Tax=Streptomyces sp. NBC_00287 TaxID=2975702 RepID=UPI002E295E66|nr:extracellular solute-binding protein [Streptomyces sp. NBC_00287]